MTSGGGRTAVAGVFRGALTFGCAGVGGGGWTVRGAGACDAGGCPSIVCGPGVTGGAIGAGVICGVTGGGLSVGAAVAGACVFCGTPGVTLVHRAMQS